MLLKSVKLENIRSYLNQSISFPNGSVLLSGDVGSGKSSILLAIEFALFGVRRKHLSGSSLLRHGKNTGSVELSFDIDGKEVIIKRILKRSKKDIQQEAGYVVIDGIKKEATAVELKTEILKLLGYPKELITKTKNLVYRYTVYTPQEEMKQILTEEQDERLDTLRKVFGIDRYKKIRENSTIFIRDLKDKIKQGKIRIENLEEKKRLEQEKKKLIEELNLKIKEINPKLDDKSVKIKEINEKLKQIEEKIKEQSNIKKELEIYDVELRNKLEQHEQNKKREEELTNQIDLLKRELVGKTETNNEKIRNDINETEKKIEQENKKILEIKNKINEIEIRKKNSSEIKQKILSINQCPTCEQEVSKEHKESVLERENENIQKGDRRIKELSEEIIKIERGLQIFNQELNNNKKKEQEFSIIKFKFDNLKEKENSLKNILMMQDKIKEEIGRINIKKLELSKKIIEDKEMEEENKKLRQENDLLMQEQKKLELDKRGFEREKEVINQDLILLEKEIQEKLAIKKKINYLSELQNWLEKFFIKLMGTIEKQVMLNIYHEFNELFENWFGMLMENENINARLDDNFTPIIQQNGYETDIEHLSGGERTAAALAYRLALNKVINDLMKGIKTKDMIILDEPTDGFSSEQLDKVRDVLEQIGVNQTIIVSHESKIESFVDNVIRINKNEHISEII
ncbi:AAA family ATPase [Candidatus Woesearchaeota archaeon]|nr:AAA family ATPase [Candidatus Woesearchaeota archaeon]